MRRDGPFFVEIEGEYRVNKVSWQYNGGAFKEEAEGERHVQFMPHVYLEG